VCKSKIPELEKIGTKKRQKVVLKMSEIHADKRQ
jgi:hypothetical protein